MRTYPGCSLGIVLILVASASPVSAGVAASQPVTLTGIVPANWPDDMVAPIAVPLRDGPLTRTGELIVEGRQPERVTIQCEPAGPAGAPQAWFVCRRLSADARGRKVTLRLVDDAPGGKPVYQSRMADPELRITTPDGAPILSYWHGKPNPAWRMPLNDFIHPLMGLDGEVLTDLIPKDHYHHRGIFWAWVRHEQDGRSVGDWWHPKQFVAEPGKIVFTDGPAFTRVSAAHIWTHKSDGKDLPIVDEQAVIRVFPTTPAGRAVDVDITLTALVSGFRFGGTLELGKGYGGLTVRYAPATDRLIEADGKKIEKDLNQLKAAWADWSGKFNTPAGKPSDRRSGIAVFVHPSHPEHPPEWITRFYGVLNVSYPGLKMLELPEKAPLRLRYRLWIHRGDATEGQVDAGYRAYAADWKWKQQ